MKYNTINAALAAIREGASATDVAAEIAGSMDYAISYYDCTAEEVDALKELRSVYKPKEIKKVVVISSLKKCDCGCTVPASLAMSASCGSACPDCYDRMS
jgi:hypothetical protein